MSKINIAIDGPASAGKSTIAKKIAEKLNFTYLDTGAMYRALTHSALTNNVPIDDGKALAALLDRLDISFDYVDGQQHVFINREDVTEVIRDPEVTSNVSQVSSHAAVREKMVKRQQQIAVGGGVVMDGRDIGTVVLPNAEVKIFMVASPEERALRRYKEYRAKGIEVTLEDLTAEMKRRDDLDMNRAVSPLRKAEDALEFDSTPFTIDECVQQMMAIINKKIDILQ